MKRYNILTAWICLFMAASMPVLAEQTVDDDTDTIIVRAKRYVTPLAVPVVSSSQSNTTVVTSKTIADNHYLSVQEALQKVNGVTVTDQVPGISSYIRLNGDDRVLILVNGQSIANAQSAAYGRGSVDLATLPGVANIDRIEVTKGSGSVKYGSGAVGGVINIITKKGNKNSTTLDMNTGSWGTHNYTLSNEGTRGNTSWYVTGSLNHRKYYKFNGDGYNTDQSRGDFNKDSFTARIDQKLNAASSLTFDVSHTNSEGHGSTFGSSETDDLIHLTANKIIERLNNDYSVTYHFRENTQTPGFLRYFNDYSQNYWTYRFHSRTQGVQLQNSWKADNSLITAGTEWTEDTGTNAAAGYIDQKRTNRAFYVEDAIDWGKLTVTPGIRVDDNSQFGVHKTPRLAVNYRANSKFNAYANWGRVFAAPKLNDLYYYLVGDNKVSYGDPNLRPETGYTQTVGFTYQYDAKTLFNFSLFRSSLDNAIRWDRGTGYSEVRNLNKEKKNGVEISMNKTINAAWDYELGYAYIHTRIDEGDGLGLHLDETFNRPNGYHAGLHYHARAWRANLFMTAGTGRNDTYYMNNSYVVWDANISYDMNKDMTLYAAVNNLTNEGYDLYHNYPMSGRYWQVGVKYTF